MSVVLLEQVQEELLVSVVLLEQVESSASAVLLELVWLHQAVVDHPVVVAHP